MESMNYSFIPTLLTTPFSVLRTFCMHQSFHLCYVACLLTPFRFFLSPSYHIYYSNGTNTGGGAYGDTLQDFLPSSFCSKRNVYLIVLPIFWEKIHHGPFTPINLLTCLLKNNNKKQLLWTFECPSEEMKKKKLGVPSSSPLPTSQA